MLSIVNLTKYFYRKGKKIKVLDNINLLINRGDIIGLIGPNGAGKTTLIKCICGLVQQSSGDIYYNGKLLTSNIVRANIGVMLEGARNIYHFLTINDNLTYFGNLNHLKNFEIEKKKEELLDIFDLKSEKNTVVNELSRGTQQKVAIMTSLLKNPSILILDEPTLGLDLVSTVKMKRTIKDILGSKNTSIVILISHDMGLISDVCNRIILLNNGKVDFDQNIGKIISNSEYEIEIELNENALPFLQTSRYKYNLQENIINLKINNLDDILNISKNLNILSIKRIDETLESFISRRLGRND